ncbi:MAG TPA: iron-containing alcohol dehydrogenase [Candidatus Mediterraneibacter merdipullorum]|nr:iron-containing alcohol dehydrogenase [Candidatus Mediterraneibacter merdipullorum]
MESFRYDNHTVLIFGRDSHKKTGEEVRKYGTNAMIVFYGQPYERPIIDDIERTMDSVGIKYLEFTGVKPNPEMKTVLKGIEIARKNKIDFLLAVGGGSVIDTAKGIGAGVLHKGEVRKLWTGEETLEATLPVGVVVTFPATGSESSSTSTITDEKEGVKLGLVNDAIRPVFAIQNPELTYTLPAYQTFCGITDMMSHAMERYFSKTRNTELIDRMGEALMRTCMKAAVALLDNSRDYAARSEVMLAASLAHNDLLGFGKEADCVSHAVGMAISSYNDTAHGATLSVITPAWMKYVYKDNLELFATFAANVMGVCFDVNDLEGVAREGIFRLEEFYKRIGMPVRLSEVGIDGNDESVLNTLVKMAGLQMGNEVWGSLVKATPENCYHILKLAI